MRKGRERDPCCLFLRDQGLVVSRMAIWAWYEHGMRSCVFLGELIPTPGEYAVRLNEHQTCRG